MTGAPSVIALYLAALAACVLVALAGIYRRRGRLPGARVWVLIGVAAMLGVVTLIIVESR